MNIDECLMHVQPYNLHLSRNFLRYSEASTAAVLAELLAVAGPLGNGITAASGYSSPPEPSEKSHAYNVST